MELIFQKTKVYEGLNNVHRIFLSLTQAVQIKLIKCTHFFAHCIIYNLNDLLAIQVLSQLAHFNT